MGKRVIVAEGEPMLRREGLTEVVQPWEDGLRADTRPGHFEWWYFDAHLDDGSTAVIIFLTKPITERKSPPKPSVQINLARPDGSRMSRFPVYPAAQLSAAREGCDVSIGPSWVRGDLHRYELHAEAPGPNGAPPLAADLTFTGSVPAWRPGAGKIYFDEACTSYFGWLPSIPFGSVEGSLTYDGKTHQVRGSGYHDHNWGNVDLNRVFSHWYWGRAHVGDFTAIFVEIVTTRAYGSQKIPFLLLAQGDRVLTGDGSRLTLDLSNLRDHPDGKSYAEDLDYRWQSGEDCVRLAVHDRSIIEATSLLIYLPKWQARLARLIVNPYYFRFNAELDLTVRLAGVKARERGPAINELMILH